jgi:CRISPR-associated protein Cas2
VKTRRPKQAGFYFLGANWEPRIEHVGAKPATDLGGSLIA